MTKTLDANQVNTLDKEAVSKVVNATYGTASFLWNGQSNERYLSIKILGFGDGRYTVNDE
ncbi:hypothetical protein BSK52_10710 [Paenibacillus odorifer]|uniref:Uncharacterized protein n=1 Tax=Paenibacillus odorifer TaxID=189426 RepID=A0A1R0Y207_9BACL|nr:hypothetical protein BSK52_10710 [Paenibacillus odorifer]